MQELEAAGADRAKQSGAESHFNWCITGDALRLAKQSKAEQVQSPEVAGSEEKMQQLEVAEESDYSDSEVQCMVCEPEEQSLHTVLVAEETGLVAYGLQSRQVVEPSWMAEHEKQGHPYRRTVLGVFRAD